MPTISQIQTRLEEALNERYAILSYHNLTDEQKEANKTYYDGFCAAVSLIGEWRRYTDGTHLVSLYGIVPDNWDNEEEWE